ncbi:MAG: transcription-repair coupling factor [Desulfohalobiaceae bacterium]
MLIPPRIKRIFTESEKITLSVYKSGPGTQAFLAHSALQSGRDVVVLMRDSRELQEFQALTRLLSPAAEDSKNFWDQRWIVFDDLWSESRAAAWGRRWAALFALSMGQGPKGVLATVDNFLPYWPELQALEEAHLFLFKSEDVPLQEIQDKLSCWGYERVSLVSRPGEFSCRGDILDVFAPGYELPVRLEFFADTLESMRLFEPLSQRSSQELSQLVLLPVAPAVLSPGYILQAREYWSHLWKTGELSKAQKSRLELRLEEDPAYIWPGLFYAQKSTLQQWLKTESIFLVPHAEQLVPCLQEKEQIWREHQQRQDGQDVDIPGELLVQSAERARQTWLDKSQILFEDLHGEQPNEALELAEKRYASFQDLFWKPETRTRPWRTLQQALQEWSRTKNQVILSFQQEHSRSRFLKLFQDGLEAEIHTEYQPGKKGIYALISSLDSGLELQWNHLLLLAEDVLQPRKEQTASRAAARKGDFKGLSSSDQIQDGDLLVHRDYGVGRFAGLTRLQVDEAGNDYLLLLYAQGDKLYVPVDRLNLVQPFKGPDGSSPELDKLGSNRWGRTKDRVRKALEAIAQDLVQMYAYRKVAKGYVYPSVDELYREFEATFDFQETPDQEQAISEVLRDMESPEPMDRLICGDAGFGKTEVAMRAAFRAVAAGKQVALLCPTTVLAEQHYQNFKARMQDFSVHVELLSRFVPVSRQKKILEQAEKGAVDILIGTHRLLSNDVRLPKLTLFILDEEQRFGVRHKEKLKEIRRNIDVLTLTATPIPRTLQLSLSGIRQLSVIETPPQERKPVKSGLIEKDSAELRQILRREMERGGQVFWVYNRVQGLEKIKEYVQSLVPEARVGIAHGQLSERRLEEAMHSFWHGKLDVLVCTAIIESGLDFPRANTLIVDQAQMFGLGQLYQLRGRVGRSRHQAYAYFLVPSVAALPEKAKKRLQAVLEMDYMGAGFHVAMEDLRIRGAGNILGEMQSGNMNKVGLELFLEMLEQEVRKYKGEELNQKSEPELNITFEANIPGSYISDPQERLYYYRKISSAADSQVLRGWEEEIQDRFGPMPEQLRNLFSVLELKLILARLQVDRADLFPNRAVLSWPDDSRPLDPEAFLSWLNHCNLSARFQPPAKLELRFEDKASISNAIRITGQELGVLQEQARN